MLHVLIEIWNFLCQLKSIFITIYFAIHGLLRFIVRLPAAVMLFIDVLPVWVVPVAVICLMIGLASLITGRQ